MHTRLYAGSPLKQDSFQRAQALGLEGKTGKTGGTERAKRAKRHAIFSARSLPVKRNGTERKRSVFFDAYCTCIHVHCIQSVLCQYYDHTSTCTCTCIIHVHVHVHNCRVVYMLIVLKMLLLCSCCTCMYIKNYVYTFSD